MVLPQRTRAAMAGTDSGSCCAALPTVKYDPVCYLCPGNLRANGEHTPPVRQRTYVFENDFAALKLEGETGTLDVDDAGLLRASTEHGVCRVLCFDPRHDLTLATMDGPQVRRSGGNLGGAGGGARRARRHHLRADL